MHHTVLFCSRSGCSLSREGAEVWSREVPFSACKDELLRCLQERSERVRVLLDGWIVGMRSISLEQVSSEDREAIVRAQAVYELDIPDEFVRCSFIPLEAVGERMQGTLLYWDARVLASFISELSTKKGIDIDSVRAVERPEVVLWDGNTLRQERGRTRKRIIAVLVLALFCGGASLFLQWLSDTISVHTQVKQQELVAEKRTCALLKEKALLQKRQELFRTRAEQQRKRLDVLFAGIATAAVAGLSPRQVRVDCEGARVEISGTARTSDTAAQYIERLRKNVLADAMLTSLEHDRMAYRFTMEGRL